jgi:hypothetical protein
MTKIDNSLRDNKLINFKPIKMTSSYSHHTPVHAHNQSFAHLPDTFHTHSPVVETLSAKCLSISDIEYLTESYVPNKSKSTPLEINKNIISDQTVNKTTDNFIIKPFESLKITTQTACFYTEGCIDIKAAFELLQVTRVNLPIPKRPTKKFKIPHCGHNGSLLSIRMLGITRGIVRSLTKKFFSHSTTIDVSCRDKMVSVKLAPNSIHMCGLTSSDMSYECAGYIIQHLIDVQKYLDFITNEPIEAEKCFSWIKDNTTGEEVKRKVSSNMTTKDGRTLVFNREVKDNYLKCPEEIPNEINADFIRYILNVCNDYEFLSDLTKKIDWIRTIKNVYVETPRLIKFSSIMINYNYELGFPVDRFALCMEINKINEMNEMTGDPSKRERRIYARYDNRIDYSVSIELLKDGNGSVAKKTRKKTGVASTTLIVYQSGNVTLSAGTEELARESYYMFMNIISVIRPVIIGTPVPVKKVKVATPAISYKL